MHPHMTPQRSRSSPSAMTLLEVLIALVLLAALAAIVAPALISRLDERAFEAAADGTNEQLMMARAHAQATGEAVEVTYSPATGQVQARMYAPWDVSSDLAAIEPGTSPLAPSGREQSPPAERTSSLQRSSGSQLMGASPSAGQDPDSIQSGRAITEGWASRPLGRGIRIGTHRPFDPDAEAFEEICLPDGTLITVDAVDAGIEELANGQDVRLAVFMPDGSAMVGAELWLDDGQGRCGRIIINPWSGLPMFSRLADRADDASGSADESDADDASFAADPADEEFDRESSSRRDRGD